MAQEHVPHKTKGSSASGNDEEDREILESDFIVQDADLGALHASHEQTARALSGLAALLEKLLVAADEVNDAAPADDVDEERSVEEDEDKESERSEERKKKTKKAEEILDELDASFRCTVKEALRQHVTPNAVPFLLNLPSAAIAYVLLHAQLRRRLEIDSGHTIAHDLREILREAFSIDGMTLGGSYGWLVRAWASDECSPAVTESLQSNGTTNELVAFVLAGLAFSGPVRERDAVAQGILGGLHLVLARSPNDPISEELRNRLAAVAQSSGNLFGVPELESVLGAYEPEKLNLIPAVRCWKALKRVDMADKGLVTSEAVANLRRFAPELLDEYLSIRGRLRPPLGQASAIENGVKCGACQMMLPGAEVQRLAAPLPEFARCSFCHRILIPVNVDDGISEKVVQGLEASAEVAHA